MSTNTGVAPNFETAMAAEVNVYDGRITSSPGFKFINMLAISKSMIPLPALKFLPYQVMRNEGSMSTGEKDPRVSKVKKARG